VFETFDEDVRLIASEETLGELERVMEYEHLPFTEADRAQYPALLRREADVVRPEVSVDVVRDADDDKFLGVALAADADYVVSGDDLLAVGSYRNVGIVTPAEFVDRVE
jgi:putative PIN family toxin of toxin-antitoxin system